MVGGDGIEVYELLDFILVDFVDDCGKEVKRRGFRFEKVYSLKCKLIRF